MNKFLNLDSPFYKPVWIRVLLVAVLAGWGMFEVSMGAVIWAIIFLGLAGICAWRFATIDYNENADK